MPQAGTARAAAATATAGEAEAQQHDSEKCHNDAGNGDRPDDWDQEIVVHTVPCAGPVLRIDVDNARGCVAEAGARHRVTVVCMARADPLIPRADMAFRVATFALEVAQERLLTRKS